jgi:hypothetical protein
MGRKRKFKKQDILDALKGSYGIVSEVADKLGVDWHTADDGVFRAHGCGQHDSMLVVFDGRI